MKKTNTNIKNWFCLFGMLLLMVSFNVNAQVSSTYTFSSTAGTYNPISGGTVLGVAANDDDNFDNVPLGFSFIYNGNIVSNIGVNTNGKIAFGSNFAGATLTDYAGISGGGTNNIISAFGLDLQGIAGTGELSYITLGSSPSRTFVIQWKNYRRYNDALTNLNFQIRLSEGSNNINVVYGTFTSTSGTNYNAEIGLRGDSNTDFNNRSTTTDWTATTAGALNNVTCRYSSAVVPPSGRTFTWTAPATSVYYSKAAATDFNALASWGVNTDGSGAAPAAINNTNTFVIANGSNMNLNSGNANVRELFISTASSLTVGSNTLNVAAATGNTRRLSIEGTLSISGGTINVKGFFVVNGTGTFNQTGGTISVDGNDAGTPATSVPANIPIVTINSSNLNLTGGTFIIVDPHASTTATETFRYNSGVLYDAGTGHTMQFGNGVSTDAGGDATIGFLHNVFGGANCFTYGNLTINMAAGTNRFVTSPDVGNYFGVLGNLTVSNGDFRFLDQMILAGNLSVAATGTLSDLSDDDEGVWFGKLVDGFFVDPVITAQTVSGTGVFRNSVASSTANFREVSISNISTSGVTFSTTQSLKSGTNTGTTVDLNFYEGRITASVAPFIMGINATNAAGAGTLYWISGGFTSGSSFTRWTPTGNAAIPVFATVPNSNFAPFNVNGLDRMVNLNKTATGAFTTGGTVTVTHTNASGNTNVTITDGAYTVTTRSNASWTFTTGNGFNAGVRTFTVGLTGEGQMVLNTAPGTAPRLVRASTVVGTHAAGTGTVIVPVANRSGLTATELTGAAFYIGANIADLEVYSVNSGPWETTTTWNTGVVPTASQRPIISAGTTVTVNGAAAVATNVIVQGILNVSGSTLTVSGSAASQGITISASGTLNLSGGTIQLGTSSNTACNRTFNCLGNLNVTGGNLNIEGNLIIASAAVFTQSAGNINVDGNAGGVAANSVAVNVPLVAFNTINTAHLNLTGGTLTIVDPHANGTVTNAFRYAGIVNHALGLNYTIQLGNGVSTDAGGNAVGFQIEPFYGTSRLLLGNLTLSANGGTNRIVTTQYANQILQVNNLTIDASSELRMLATCPLSFAGNLVNNGTLTVPSILACAYSTVSTGTYADATAAQTISGTGLFRNLVASPTAEINGFLIQNSSVAGVTLNLPITASGDLYMLKGKVNTTATNFLGSNSSVSDNLYTGIGTIGYVNGPFRKTIPASSAAFNGWCPVGETAANWFISTCNTNVGGPFVFQVEVNNSLGVTNATDGSITAMNPNREWVVSVISGSANLTTYINQIFDNNILSSQALAYFNTSLTQWSILGSSQFALNSIGNSLFNNVFLAGSTFPERVGFGDTGPLNVGFVVVNQPDLSNVIANSTNNTIARIAINTTGSTGTITLNSIKVTYNGSNPADIAPNGVKLYSGTGLAPGAQIGSGLSLVAGEADFTGLAQNITAGNTFYWVSLDVASGAILGNNIDIQVKAGDLTFTTSGGATATPPLPATLQSPVGSRLIDYCTPTYATGCATNDEISNVTLGLLNNTTGCAAGPGYYTYYNALTIPDMQQGSSNAISITMGSNANQFSGAWVDFNQNGVFETSEYFSAGTNAGANGTSTFNIVVPGGATLGNTRMRVRGGDQSAITNTQACGATNSARGETEDYIVNITNPLPQVIGTITATQQTGGMGVNTTNNNLLRVEIPITGSAGTQTLNSLRFTYTGVTAADIAALGASLWDGNITTPLAQIGTSQSVSGGFIIFTGLSLVLSPGTNYLWLRVNTSTGATIPNIVDATIAAGDIGIAAGGAATPAGTLPASLIDPSGSRFIDYCAPTYANGCGLGDAITNVVLNGNSINLANASTCASAPYYTFFNGANKPDLFQSGNYSISITLGTDINQYSGVWIDFNQNGDFETSEYFSAGTNAGGSGTSTFNIAVPVGAVLGDTRMRIRGGNDAVLVNDQACGVSSSSYGETEDYLVTIIPPPNCSTQLPFPASATTATITDVCVSQSVSFGLTVPMPSALGITYQLRRGGVPQGAASNSLPILNTVSIGGTYDIQVLCNGTPQLTSTPIVLTVSNPTVTPGANATRCGTGTAQLTASFGGGASTVRWFDAATGGTLKGLGSPYTSEELSTGTYTYWVESVKINSTINGGAPSPAVGTFGEYFGGADDIAQVFNTSKAVTIASVDIYPTEQGPVEFNLYDNLFNLIATYTYNVSLAEATSTDFSIGTPVTVPLNFSIPAGNDWQLEILSSNGLLRNDDGASSYYGVNYNGLTFTDNWIGDQNYWYWAYNYQIQEECASPRQSRTITVNPAPALTLSTSNVAICGGAPSAPVTIVAPSPSTVYNTYSWTPATDVSPATGPGPYTFSPTASGQYTLNATQTGGAQCVNSAVVNITFVPGVNAGVANITSGVSICEGTNVSLTATGFTLPSLVPDPALSLNFESGLNGWNIVSSSTGGDVPSLGNFNVRPHGYEESFVIFDSPGGSNFLLANSDAQGSGGTSNTQLVSPSFSTVGLASTSLSFRHHYYGINTGAANRARIQYSVDGGGTWVTPPLAIYQEDFIGTESAFQSETINLPAGALNQPNVKVRFIYRGDWDYYWAIDDITINFPTINYSWTGPNTFTSNLAAPTPFAGTPAANGVYTVVATNVAGCTATASTASLSVSATPTISVLGTFETCENGQINFASVSAPNGTITWTVQSGGGDFVNPNALNAVYDATLGTPALPGTTVTVRATVTNPPCAAVFQDITITIRPRPIVTSVGSTNLCIANPSVDLSISNTGAFDGPNTIFNWAPVGAGLYTDNTFATNYNGGNATSLTAAPFTNTNYQITATNIIDGCVTTATVVPVTVCPQLQPDICGALSATAVNVTSTPTWGNFSLLNQNVPALSEQIAAAEPNRLGRSLWRRTIVPANGEIAVYTSNGINANAGLNIDSTIIHIYRVLGSNTCTGSTYNGTLIQVDANSGGAAGNHGYVHASGLTPGEVIYIRISKRIANSAYTAPTTWFSDYNPKREFRMAVTNGLIWTAALNDDFNNPGNWFAGDATSLTLTNASRSAIIPSAVTKPRLASGNAITRGITFTAVAPYYVSPGIDLFGNTLEVRGNWAVGPVASATSTLNCNGIVLFNGTIATPQSITGKTTFGNLHIDNATGGVNIVNPTNVTCVLSTINGTLTTNGSLTLKSSAANTAALVRPGSGTVSGNVSVERKIGPASGYHYLSSPVSGAFVNNTTSGWRDDFTINDALSAQVFTPGTVYSSLATVWQYNESNTNPLAEYGWISATGVGEQLTPIKGFACVVPANVTVDVFGPLNNGSVPGYFITKTPGTGVGEGVNLIGNPYASPITWNVWQAANPSLSSVGYQTFITSGGYAGTYGTWNGTTGSPISVNGKIASSQAVLVTAASPGFVTATNAIRLTTDADVSSTFYSGNIGVNDLIRLEVQGNGYTDETAIYFEAAGQDNYNSNIDARKLFSPVAGVPNIYSVTESQSLNINQMGNLNMDKVVPLGVKIQTAGTYNIVATDMTSFAPSVVAYLEDTQTGTMTNLRTNPSYSVTLPVGEVQNRFYLHFHPAVEFNAVDETCAGNDGKLVINYPTSNTVNVVIKDVNGAVVCTQNNVSGIVTINNLVAGNYVAEMTFGVAPNIYTTSDYFTVSGGNAVYANLSASANTVDMNANTTVNFTATAQGATGFNWNFGDGSVITNGPANISHTFTQVGTYNVTFEASNGICNTVATTTVEVTNATGLTSISNSNIQVVGIGSKVVVRFGNKMEGTGNIEVINMLGEVVAHLDNVSMKGTREIEMSSIAAGQYMVKITNNSKLYTEKVFLSRQ